MVVSERTLSPTECVAEKDGSRTPGPTKGPGSSVMCFGKKASFV